MAEKTQTVAEETTTATPEPMFEAFEFEDHTGDGDSRLAIGKDDVREMLGYALDKEHYLRLESASPEIAHVLKLAVQAGWSPEEIRRWAVGREEHPTIARWLEQAMRYLAIEEDGA